MLLRSQHKFQQENKRFESDLNPDKTMKRQIILSHNMKKGVVTKNRLLTKEMRSRLRIKVATPNAIDSKTARS